ncbi:MAG TPA: signal recognition particle-docking protein FtsY [Lapillicoccus sp.]|nr:signal recognition particle-docking protein FtsY [Lapillicoccus sp.]
MDAVFDQVWEIVAVVLLVAIVLVAGIVGLVRGRSSRQKQLSAPPAPPAPPRPSTTTAPPTDLDTDAEGGVGTIEAPRPPAPPEPEPDVDVLVEELPTLERPASARGRLARLRARLARSNTAIGNALLGLLSRGGLDEEAWEEVEDTLIQADLGVDAATELVDRLRTKVKVDGSGATSEAEVKTWLKEDLLELVGPDLDRRIASSRIDGRPAVILVVGVNGTGKTTTVGKLARVLVSEDRDVVLGAADTFRAAAADQLETWGARVGVPTIRSEKDGADPAAVAFDAVKAATEIEADVVIIDTAGRLHNKVGLMDELGKVKRVIEKQSPIDEVLLVLDATTGQNGMRQAEVFSEAVDVTGIVLTKLDGTAKGGIVVAVQRKLGVPVKLVGLGEGPDDLAPFDPEAFVDAIVG